MATILKDEDVNSLEVDVDLMEADIVPRRKILDNVGIMDVAITSSKNVERNLVDLSGHSLSDSGSPAPCGTSQVLHLLFMALPQLYCRRSMIVDSDS